MINWLFICRVNFVPFLLPWQWYVAHLSMLSKAERRAWVRSCRQRGERPPMYPSGHQCIPSHQRTSNLLLPTTHENHAVEWWIPQNVSTFSTVCSVSLYFSVMFPINKGNIRTEGKSWLSLDCDAVMTLLQETISSMFQYYPTKLYHTDFIASLTLSDSDCEIDFEWRLHHTGS